MQDKFLESIRMGFISEINEIISQAQKEAEEKGLNAIDTLILVNNSIHSWIQSISGMFHIDEEMLTEVAKLKNPFVTAAKKEVSKKIAEIIENETGNVTLKISNFLSELKGKGIDLDDEKEVTNSVSSSNSKTVKNSEETVKNSEETVKKPEKTVKNSGDLFARRYYDSSSNSNRNKTLSRQVDRKPSAYSSGCGSSGCSC